VVKNIKSEHLDKVRSYTFLGVLIFITLVFLYSVRGLLMPIFFGVVFAIVLYPFYRRLSARMRNARALPAIIVILLAFIILAGIFYILGSFVIRDAVNLFDTVSGRVDEVAPKTNEVFQKGLNILPGDLSDKLGQIDFREQVVNAAKNTAQSVLGFLQSVTKNTLRILGLSLITLYATFYLLINGFKWSHHLARVIPLPQGDEEYLSHRFVAMVKASLKVVFIMGAIQGFLGGLIFYLLGISSPFFWGLIFAIVSLIPGLGHPLVWIPTAFILAVSDEPVKALILILYGAFVMGFSDDLLRPFLLGRQQNIHPFLILIATLGGIATFGFAGLVLGPVVASLLVAIWELYEKRYTSG